MNNRIPPKLQFDILDAIARVSFHCQEQSFHPQGHQKLENIFNHRIITLGQITIKRILTQGKPK